MSKFIDDMRGEGVPNERLYHLELTARFFGMEPDPFFDIPEDTLSGWARAVLFSPEENEMRDWALDWIEPYLEELLSIKYPGLDFGEAFDLLVTERFEGLPEPQRSTVLAFQGYDEAMIEFFEMTARFMGEEPDLSVDIDAEKFARFKARDNQRSADLHPATREVVGVLASEMAGHMERNDLPENEMDDLLAKTTADIIRLVTADEQKRDSTVH